MKIWKFFRAIVAILQTRQFLTKNVSQHLKLPPYEDLKVFRAIIVNLQTRQFLTKNVSQHLKIPPYEDLKVFCGPRSTLRRGAPPPTNRWLFSNPPAKISKFLRFSIRRHSSGLRPSSLTWTNLALYLIRKNTQLQKQVSSLQEEAYFAPLNN